MEINWDRVRRILLNDRFIIKYKPSKAVFRRIGLLLPDANIFGWAWYAQSNCWALLVESKHFTENPYGVILDIDIGKVHKYSPPLYLLPAKPSQ